MFIPSFMKLDDLVSVTEPRDRRSPLFAARSMNHKVDRKMFVGNGEGGTSRVITCSYSNTSNFPTCFMSMAYSVIDYLRPLAKRRKVMYMCCNIETCVRQHVTQPSCLFPLLPQACQWYKVWRKLLFLYIYMYTYNRPSHTRSKVVSFKLPIQLRHKQQINYTWNFVNLMEKTITIHKTDLLNLLSSSMTFQSRKS
jgi:hypothetical protein